MRRILHGLVWTGLYLVVSLAPLVVALIPPSPASRGFWTDLSVALGFVGLSMIGLQFALTARFRRVAAPFGIDVVLQFHRQISVVALGLILAHPIVLFTVDPSRLALLNVFDTTWQARWGIVSVLAFLAILVTSLWRLKLRLSYEAWRLLHGILAVVALATALTHVVIAGHYVATPWKAAFWIGMSAAVVGLLFWTRVVNPLLLLRRPYRVASVTRRKGDAWSVVLEPEGHEGMRFEAGQFAWLTVRGTPYQLEEHPFSFSSSDCDAGRVEMTIKELGDFTSSVGELEPGTRAYLDGPYGAFRVSRNEGPGFVFLAGGIGITPVMSILRSMADRAEHRPLMLIYANPSLEDATFRDEIHSLKDRLDLTVIEVPEESEEDWEGETGYVTGELLDRHLPDHGARHRYFLCGPDPMMNAVVAALHERGVDPDHIVLERFQFA